MIFNINTAHACISDQANLAVTNKGFETAISVFDKNRMQKLEDGFAGLKECQSIKFLRIDVSGYFTEIVFEIAGNNSADTKTLTMPYINGLEKLDGYSRINFSLAQILMATFEIDELNNFADIIPTKTCLEIKELIEKDMEDELFGSDYEEEVYDDFSDMEDYSENDADLPF